MIFAWPWNVPGVYFRRDLSAWLRGRRTITARPIIRGLPAATDGVLFRLGCKKVEAPAHLPSGCSWLCGFFNGDKLVGCLSDGRLEEARIPATLQDVEKMAASLSGYVPECDGLFLEDGEEYLRYVFREGIPGRVLEALPHMNDYGRVTGRLKVMRRGHEVSVFCDEPLIWDSFMPGCGDMILLDENDRLLFCIDKGNNSGMSWPSTCPWCGFALHDGICENPACSERKKVSLRLFCNILEVDVPRKDFFDLANLEDGKAGPWSAFLAKRGRLSGRFSGHCLDALGRSRRNFLSLDLASVLAAFGIPGIIGREALIAPQIRSLAELFSMKEREMAGLLGIVSAKSACAWINERKVELHAMAPLFRRRRAVRKPKLGFAGVFPWPTRILKELALAAGFLVAARAGAEDMLVTASGGKNILSFEEFVTMTSGRKKLEPDC